MVVLGGYLKEGAISVPLTAAAYVSPLFSMCVSHVSPQ